jgi:hypothetical protein
MPHDLKDFCLFYATRTCYKHQFLFWEEILIQL